MQITKTCTKCSVKRPLNYFSPDKRKKDGLQSHCKICRKQYRNEHRIERNTYNKQWNKEHPEKLRGIRWRYRQRHKDEAREYARYYHRKRRKTLVGHLNVIFHNIIRRCTNSKCKQYKDYGGRGIKCLFQSVGEFRDYIMNKLNITKLEQIRGLQIDRINNDGHYESGNIRFVTAKENMNNQRLSGGCR